MRAAKKGTIKYWKRKQLRGEKKKEKTRWRRNNMLK